MPGQRKWRFTSGLSTLEVLATDYWVEYSAERREDGQVLLGVKLHACWEHSNFEEPAGLARRFYVEERMRVLNWTFIGKKGTLETDFGTPRAKVFAAITLKSIAPELAKSNELLIYEIGFEYPLPNGGAEIARTISFGAVNVNAENFLVAYGKPDRTVFKEPFRAAPVRVPGGPGLKTIVITAIKKTVSGADALEKRQNGEAEVKDWAWNYVGNEGALLLDGETNLGTCHLRAVRPSDLSLPDAVVYELEFVTGYVQ